MAFPADGRRSRLLLVLILLSHLVIISRQVDAGGGLSLLERVIFAVFAPLQHGVAATIRGTRDIVSGYVGLRRVHEENLRLSERLRAAEIELSETREQAREAARLRALLGLRDRMGFETTVAEVIAMEGGPWASMITIDKGSSHGLKLNAPVICPAGVLGRVVAIGPLSAKVQLLLDRDSGVGVLIDRSRATGVLGGQRPDQLGAGGELPLRYVPVLADVVVGDVVVTSGLDQIFPKGLVVGHVSRVQANAALLKEVWVVPAAQFDQLEEVFVLQARAELPPPNATVQ